MHRPFPDQIHRMPSEMLPAYSKYTPMTDQPENTPESAFKTIYDLHEQELPIPHHGSANRQRY